MLRFATIVVCACAIRGKIYGKPSGEDSGDNDFDDSSERLGPAVTQIYRHPYTASLLRNNTFECSAVILNTYWAMTLSKCFNADITSTYVNHRDMHNYTLRTGSSYNNKGGALSKLRTIINNFDLKVSAVKVETPLVFGTTVQAVKLPKPDDEPSLGFLSSITAWTPDGHIRIVNVPVIDSSICEDITHLLPGHYICVGGVQDPDRNFCRKDNGGPVIQNNTLIGIATFYQTCAIYTRPHAFPKVSSFARWIDSVVWDEDNRPTTTVATTTIKSKTSSTEPSVFFVDPSKYMLTLPYDTVNLPLQPGEDNSVIPRISLYESYLQNMAKSKTSTTEDPAAKEKARMEWFKKYGKTIMEMMPKKYDGFEYH